MPLAGRSAALLLIATALVEPLAGQSWRDFTTSRQRGNETALDVHIAYGVGALSVEPIDGTLLYRMHVRYDEDLFDPRTEFDGRALRLGVENTGRDFRIGRNKGGEMSVELTRAVPMALDIDFGAGSAEIDLGGLSLLELNLNTGASETRLDVSAPNPGTARQAVLHVGAADFTALRLGNLNAPRLEVNAGVGDVVLDLTGTWRQDATLQVKMGLGALELRFPEGLGVKLERKTLLTSIDTEGLIKRGDAYYSPGWERAEHRLTVRVEAALGSVDVRWVR
jgi:hypothetical protein